MNQNRSLFMLVTFRNELFSLLKWVEIFGILIFNFNTKLFFSVIFITILVLWIFIDFFFLPPKEHEHYDESHCKAFHADVTCGFGDNVPDTSVDVATMIFVLSAIHPDKMQLALQYVYQVRLPSLLSFFFFSFPSFHFHQVLQVRMTNHLNVRILGKKLKIALY